MNIQKGLNCKMDNSGTKPRTRSRLADAVTGKDCPICLSRVDIRSASAIIPCLHAYCVECIRKWSDVKRNCPLCKANFSSWFRKTGSRSFREEKLPHKKMASVRRRDVLLFGQRRFIGISRRGQRVLPRQRSFVHVDPDVRAERVKHWRASVYEQRLQAVPLQPADDMIILQRAGSDWANELEPWIRRELEALLGDPDPTVIVHVVTSLFISLYERNHVNFPVPGQGGVQHESLAPLRIFLHEHTDLFWHELRCYAESSLHNTWRRMIQLWFIAE